MVPINGMAIRRKWDQIISFSFDGGANNKNNVFQTLIASIAYSTWKRRPSGENVFTPLSYSLLNKVLKNFFFFTLKSSMLHEYIEHNSNAMLFNKKKNQTLLETFFYRILSWLTFWHGRSWVCTTLFLSQIRNLETLPIDWIKFIK